MQTKFKVRMDSHPSKDLVPIELFSHYLAKVHLLEFVVEEPDELVFSVGRSCFLMYIDITANHCQLGYFPKGSFTRNVSSGANRVMIITFRAEWLKYRCQSYPEFKRLISAFQHSSPIAVMLPTLGIALSLYKSFQKMSQCPEASRERDHYLFVDSVISKYHKKLGLKQNTNRHYQEQAEAIASFISENFASELVDNIPKMAERFMVSERHLARIAKSAFGIPLHSQVIKIRMNAGLNQLINNKIPLHEVARLSGYRDPYYFSRAFKKCFQVYPKFINWQ